MVIHVAGSGWSVVVLVFSQHAVCRVFCFNEMEISLDCDAMLLLTGERLHISHNLDRINPAGAPAGIWLLTMY